MYTKKCELTRFRVHAITAAMGRKKLWVENINLTLPEGAKARMDAVLKPGEDRLEMIRTAINKEVGRRERATPVRKMQIPTGKRRTD